MHLGLLYTDWTMKNYSSMGKSRLFGVNLHVDLDSLLLRMVVFVPLKLMADPGDRIESIALVFMTM